jgi:hypothetical protein
MLQNQERLLYNEPRDPISYEHVQIKASILVEGAGYGGIISAAIDGENVL